MELRPYVNILWRRKWVILITAIVTIVVVGIGTRQTTPTYQASTTLRIAATADASSNFYIMSTYNDQLMNTYVEIATSKPVLDELSKRLNLNASPVIAAEVVPNTELIKVTATSTDPKMAAREANTLAAILITQSNSLYTGGGKTSQDVLSTQLAQAQSDLNQAQRQYENLIVQTPPASGQIDVARQQLQLKEDVYVSILTQYQQATLQAEIKTSMITVVDPATVPQAPSQPRVVLNYVLGLLAGLMGGVVIGFVVENLDNRLHDAQEIQTAAKLNLIAKIPRANKGQVNISQLALSPIAEAYRGLAAKLLCQDHQKAPKTILIMSAEPKQGATTILSNLAFSLAEYGKSVVAIDCNLRMPNLHKVFDVPNDRGLTDVLEQKTDVNKVLQKDANGQISVLTSGPVPAHPLQLLNSPEMTKLINELAQKFEYVLIDVPALLAVADVTALAKNVDGFLLVTPEQKATQRAVQAAGEFLAGFHEKYAGLVINQAKDDNSQYFYQYQ